MYFVAGYNGNQAPTISLPIATAPAEKHQPLQEDNAGGNKKDGTNAEVFDNKYGVPFVLGI